MTKSNYLWMKHISVTEEVDTVYSSVNVPLYENSCWIASLSDAPVNPTNVSVSMSRTGRTFGEAIANLTEALAENNIEVRE